MSSKRTPKRRFSVLAAAVAGGVAIAVAAIVSGKHSPLCTQGDLARVFALGYGECACAGGCQGLPSMRSHKTVKALRPCLRAVSM